MRKKPPQKHTFSSEKVESNPSAPMRPTRPMHWHCPATVDHSHETASPFLVPELKVTLRLLRIVSFIFPNFPSHHHPHHCLRVSAPVVGSQAAPWLHVSLHLLHITQERALRLHLLLLLLIYLIILICSAVDYTTILPPGRKVNANTHVRIFFICARVLFSAQRRCLCPLSWS